MATAIALLVLAGFPLAILAAIGLGVKLLNARKELRRFKPIVDLEEQVRRIHWEQGAIVTAAQEQLRLVHAQQANTVAAAQEQVRLAHAQQAEAAAALDALRREHGRVAAEVVAFHQQLDLQEVGLLAPRFNFGEAVEYKIRLDQNRDRQSAMVKAGRAAVCTSEWSISGSRAEGKKVTNQILKLMLRAFNGECDALVAKVRYDNAAAFREKMRKSWESINKLGAGFTCTVTREYLDAKLDELSLTYEYQEKLYAEKEEQRALREQMRDEERAQKELERAQRDAEQEEVRYAKALDRAREEAQRSAGAKQQKLLEQIAELEQKVREAEERRQRAISMAQLTKAGHVYVLSNVGSFGEQVYKIGMTRRLVPQDRVDELGDASVPFPFDVHAMIRTDDAPSLEKALHGLFDVARMNKINRRKEFFRVTLEQIEQVVRQHHGEFQLTRQAEAMEYRKSLTMTMGQADGISARYAEQWGPGPS